MNEPTVTQADIDAAAAYWGNDNPPLELRAAFARHRTASAPAGAAHPPAPADLVERIAQLDLLQETNLPDGEWDMETFRATLALCKRHLSAALAKHGGA